MNYFLIEIDLSAFFSILSITLIITALKTNLYVALLVEKQLPEVLSGNSSTNNNITNGIVVVFFIK